MANNDVWLYHNILGPHIDNVPLRKKSYKAMMRIALILLTVFFLPITPISWAQAPKVEVKLDVSEVPQLKAWGEKAKMLVIEWHPRISNLIPSKGFTPPTRITLRIEKSNKGVGYSSGTTITVASHWIEKHPDDFGLVIHELVHVIQRYPNYRPIWLTEGIADYLRWAVYEGKPQSWFQRPKQKQGYTQGYRVTAGFLLWLETDRAPGIVNKLNTAMRNRSYTDALFQKETGTSLDELWNAYVSE